MNFYSTKSCLVLICSFWTIGIIAQQKIDFKSNINTSPLTNLEHDFEVGDQPFVLSEQVEVRASALSSSEVIASLPIGLQVEVVEAPLPEELDQFRASPYRIKFPLTNGITEGYVWGDDLAIKFAMASQDEGILFLYGRANDLTADDQSIDPLYTDVKIHVCKSGKLLDRLVIGSRIDNSENEFWVTHHSNKGVATIQDVIEVKEVDRKPWKYECHTFVFWDGEQLELAKRLEIKEEGTFIHQYNLFFPADLGEVEGELLLEYKRIKTSKTGEEQLEEYTKTYYTWNGKSLQEIPAPTSGGEKAIPNYYNLKKLEHSFEVGSLTKTLANRVNVRAQPSTTAPTLFTLPLGTSVKILEKRIEEHSHRGFVASWYRVSFKYKGQWSEGYIWGGLLALTSFSSQTEPNTVFLVGRVPEVKPSAKDADKYYPEIQIRVCQAGQELANMKLTTQLNYGNHDYWVKSLGGQTLAGVKDILQIGESQLGAGGYQVKNIIFWNGEELLLMEPLQIAGGAEEVAQQALIFPQQEGGMESHILKSISTSKTPYKWTGKRLKKGKTQPQ